VRIVAGSARGRRLVVPAGDDVRPTADRVREALFSSLQGRLAGARVLDLFAGSGALALEAASRGAASVTLVERDRRALEAIRRNVRAVDPPQVTVCPVAVERALAGVLPGGPFDLVLLDPPYRLPHRELAAVLAALEPHLADGAMVVVERSARDGVPHWPPGLTAGPARRYGDTVLHRAVRSPVGSDGAPGPGLASDPGPIEEQP